MQVELREFEEGDISRLSAWADRIGADRFMSRHRPLDRGLHKHSPEHGLLWFVVRVDGMDVGTVWLERETDPSVARLGVLLGDQSLFGLGIGEEAVKMAVARACELSVRKLALHVRLSNKRAIACYRKCGFVLVKSGVKGNPDGSGFTFLRMERELGLPTP